MYFCKSIVAAVTLLLLAAKCRGEQGGGADTKKVQASNTLGEGDASKLRSKGATTALAATMSSTKSTMKTAERSLTLKGFQAKCPRTRNCGPLFRRGTRIHRVRLGGLLCVESCFFPGCSLARYRKFKCGACPKSAKVTKSPSRAPIVVTVPAASPRTTEPVRSPKSPSASGQPSKRPNTAPATLHPSIKAPTGLQTLKPIAKPVVKSSSLPSSTPSAMPNLLVAPITPTMSLVNTATGVEIARVKDGTVIDLSTLPSWSMRVDAEPSTRSVVFTIAGIVVHIDNDADPFFALNGNARSVYNPVLMEKPLTLECGQTWTVAQYDSPGATGNRLSFVSYSFCVVNSTQSPSALPSAMPNKAPSMHPTVLPSRMPSTYPSIAPSTTPSSAPTGCNKDNSTVCYINSIAQCNRVLSLTGTTAEDKALQWLVYNDTTVSPPTSAIHKFKLRQRFALLTLWFQQPPAGHEAEDWWWWDAAWLTGNECDDDIVTCKDVDFGGDIGVQQTVVEMDAYGNGFVGTLPPDLGLLIKLEELYLYDNFLTGTLPTTVGQWTNMVVLSLGNNALNGSLPTEIGSWNELTYIGLYSNALTGSLPLQIGHWSKVEFVALDINRFRGSIPESVSNWSEVQAVGLSFNQLSGSLPSTMANWTSIIEFGARSNNLTGSLSALVVSRMQKNLNFFDVSSNRFSNTLPTELGLWKNILTFNISHNTFTGSLPSGIALWDQLRDVDIRNNTLATTGNSLEPICGKQFLRGAFGDCSVACSCCSERAACT